MTARYTVVITIGRNVGERPLAPIRWSFFKEDICNELAHAKAEVVQRPTIGGVWCSQLGQWGSVLEDAATFVAFVPEAALAELRDGLDAIRCTYRQEAIGFIAVPGVSHVISGDA